MGTRNKAAPGINLTNQVTNHLHHLTKLGKTKQLSINKKNIPQNGEFVRFSLLCGFQTNFEICFVFGQFLSRIPFSHRQKVKVPCYQ